MKKFKNALNGLIGFFLTTSVAHFWDGFGTEWTWAMSVATLFKMVASYWAVKWAVVCVVILVGVYTFYWLIGVFNEWFQSFLNKAVDKSMKNLKDKDNNDDDNDDDKDKAV